MRTLYAVGICLFLLVPSDTWAQEKQPQQGTQPTQSTQSTQATKPSTAKPPAEAVPHPLVITPEEKALKNPVKFTEHSVQKGRSLYMTQCAMCHGKNGDGKGDLASVMHVSPPDFTNPETLAKRTDGELYTIINKGSLGMPAEGDRLKKKQSWDLVNFLRSLEGKKPAKSSQAEGGTAQP